MLSYYFYLGSWASNLYQSSNQIAEIIVYDRVLTSTESSDVYNYLSNKYMTTPEPGTLVLLATGLVGLLAYAWRKRK